MGVMETINGVKDGYSRTALPIINGFNGLLTKILPGKEELVIIAIAAFIGYKLKQREYVIGGWSYFFKAALVVYLILKLFGFGINLLGIVGLG
jgi:hypothetical protein